jgi:LPS-assembly protein
MALVGGSVAYAQGLGSFGSFAGARTSHTGRVDLSGNEFVYDAKSDTFIARGNARLRQGPTLLQAHQMEFNRKTQVLKANGDVSLTDPEVDLTASSAEVDIENETGQLQNGKVRVKQSDYYLTGRKVTKLLGQHYRVLDGYFTTCGCEQGTPSWSIAGDEIDATLGDKGTVRNARFQVLGHTVMVAPYAVFPANSDRQSGFLSPLLGESRTRGFQYFQPYFIDINRSMDATVAFDVETSARIGGMAEYRLQNGEDDYVRVTGGFFNESIRTDTANEIVDNQIADPTIPINRYGLIGVLREHLTPSLVAYGDGIAASDSLYFRDMDIYTLSHGYGMDSYGLLNTGISDFGLQQSFDNSYVLLDGVWTQDYIQAQKFALQKLPELLWSGRQNLDFASALGFGSAVNGSNFGFGMPFVDYDFQGVNYYRASGIDGVRGDLHPQLTIPWRLKDYLYGWGNLGLEETVYDVSGRNINIIPVGSFDPFIGQVLQYNNQLSSGTPGSNGFLHREMIDGGFTLGSRLERVYDLKWRSLKKLKHTIEPVVSYQYVPVVDQAQLPIFDETDRIEPRSLFTWGVVSRLYGKFGGREDTGNSDTNVNSGTNTQAPANFQSGGGNVMEVAEFSLLHQYDTSHALTPSGTHFSDILASAVVYPTHYASIASITDFNPNTEQFRAETISVAFRPPWVAPPSAQQMRMGRAYAGGPYFQLNYAFVGGRTAVEQISGTAYYEFFDRLGLYYQPAYDIADKRLLYSEYGVRLKSKCNCWIFDIGINDSINPSEVQVFVQLTLGGIGSIGRNPFGSNILLNNAYGMPYGYGPAGG